MRPSKSRKLLALELDEKEGLLDEESKQELSELRNAYESECYDWADAVNDYKRDDALIEALNKGGRDE